MIHQATGMRYTQEVMQYTPTSQPLHGQMINLAKESSIIAVD